MVLIEAVRREAPQAGRPHFRRAAERIIFEEVQFRRADRQVLAIPELRLDERRIGLVGDNEKGRAVLELMEARPSEAEAGRQAAGAEPPPTTPAARLPASTRLGRDQRRQRRRAARERALLLSGFRRVSGHPGKPKIVCPRLESTERIIANKKARGSRCSVRARTGTRTHRRITDQLGVAEFTGSRIARG
ncbi:MULTISPECIES: hypothetical protein [unclassified Bradyrhizobium]|uniref:hypothetical protein n=1 Tax=unclassified Bradyrhizobium TaxID=2631580 RepID=UPI001FF7EF4C|nr:MULTISPECIES: hypothetical protein [unclassified Bradyrhizobium]MCK1268452.1 hypothetical protein [Bradyrhizobium sp. 84]MCK1373875.1 hypothetical protein [Bradyrhizobium sp. 49]MCK1612063.1 hypothetical protein [Bradyrhizobium sp. 163]MCK1764148.1 hypothetical protein [Bradyrhizobium sp. 136]